MPLAARVPVLSWADPARVDDPTAPPEEVVSTEVDVPSAALLGLIFKPTDWLAIDVAGTKSITTDAAMWTLQAGLTFIFPQPKLRTVEDDKKFERRKESRQEN